MSMDMVDDIPVRIGALKEARGRWLLEKHRRAAEALAWDELGYRSLAMRDRLFHNFRFAFRDNKGLQNQLREMDEPNRNSSMLQDLNSLSILGNSNMELLTAIDFDFLLLDEAAHLSKQLPPICIKAAADDVENAAAIRIRDQAYTHLKEVVDTIRKYGKYLFWKDEKKLKLYRSNYLRLQNNRRLKDETEEAVGDDLNREPEAVERYREPQTVSGLALTGG
ncbi:MAG: hypothetical protein GY765_35605 [bacterium]|nr:hypothetical protein [bacterium]